jgi:hypothetical protein
VGLLVVGLDASRRAGEDTTVAGLAGTVVSRLQEVAFDDLPSSDSIEFKLDGTLADNPSDGFFRCDIVTAPHSASVLPESLRRKDLGVRVRMTFYWPPDNPKPKEIFETTIARY